MHIGTHKRGDAWTFTVWAPRPRTVQLLLHDPDERTLDMQALPGGYWRAEVPGLEAGARYSYLLDGETRRADPASQLQPEGVHGPSALVDHDGYQWNDQGFHAPRLDEYVIYELHVGTFTSEGTFEAALGRLDHLKDLGVTAVEIMPVAQCPGDRNWGYDGVYPYAVQTSFGGPQAMKRFVDACHQRGMAVVLDVVYNHLGPEGNYLRDFGPYFTARYQTPWGEAVNFDGDQSDPVRAYFIQNALHWFERYHVDALRLDAVHAIYDMRPTHVLRELAEAAEEWGGRHGKRPYLIAESHMNKPRLVEPRAVGGYGLDSMWSDDFHHGVHTLLTGELEGYYMDYGRLEHLADSVRDGFAFRGQYSPYRGRSHGEPCAHLPGSAFVINIQTHDMVGNRALGERLTGLVSLEAHKAAAALMLFSPYVPLLFMGEEWAETNPFLYFIHHGDPDLVEAVRKGRKREFESFHWDEDPPDPQSEATFQRSKLDWDKPGQGRHKAMLDFYRECLRLRRTLPALADMRRDHMHVWPMHRRNTLFVQRGLGQEMVLLLCNLSRNACPVDTAEFFPDGQWTKILDSTAERWAGPGVTLADTPGDGQSLPPESLALYARKENP